jgi:L-aspartate oxidase
MSSSLNASVETDYLVIGSGVAGLGLAIKLSELGSVALISKRDLLEGSTAYAQGGIASVMSAKDSFDRHIQDTLVAGAGLCKEEVVRFVVQEGPQRVQELIDWGMKFTPADNPHSEDGPYELGLEGGHSRRRILHAQDSTGAQISKTLLKKAKSQPNVQFYDFHIAIDLISSEKLGQVSPVRCLGAYVLDQKSGEVRTFVARRAVLLATGGAGKVYLYTSNPDVSTGDGIAMAYRVGAQIANMEFVQFHPTCLYHPDAKSFLVSEAVRGEGAILRRRDGAAFMDNYHPMKELAPRDIVARAIDTELKRRGDAYVYLDIRFKGAEFIKAHFPTIYRRCQRFGIDMAKDLIPVVPAAHYFCGGVQTDTHGRTSVEGLWAIGEVSCTGLHGANRLASNSLLEGLVFAHRAYEQLRVERQVVADRRDTGAHLSAIPLWNPGNARNSDEQVVITQNWDEIRQLMWNYVGIVRSDKRLERAYRRIQLLQQEIQEYYWDFIVTSDLIELRNIATVAELVVRSASARKESRGLHFNLDHPERDESSPPQETLIQRTADVTLHVR